MPYKTEKPTYSDYKSFGWGFGSDKRKDQFRKAQILAYEKRRGQQSASAMYKARARQLSKKANRGLIGELYDWAKEGIGLGEVTADEWAFMNYYKDATGMPPPILENPYAIERIGKFVDRAFDIGTAYVGGGMAVQGVKMGLKATKLASSQLARAQTKAAVKRAVKNKMTQLAKKRTVKEAVKGAAKGTFKAGNVALEAEYKATVAKEVGESIVKGFKQVTQSR
jgi:hypothetical protein